MMKILAATAVALASAWASAAPVVLNFSGIGDGASVQDFYNSGTDSYGNVGYDYGVKISGGVVRRGFDGNNYLEAGEFGVTLSFDRDLAWTGAPGQFGNEMPTAISFLFRTPGAPIYPESLIIEVWMADPNNVERDSTNVLMNRSDWWYRDSVAGPSIERVWITGPLMLDDITFGVLSGRQSNVRLFDVPEPATLALFGAGLAGLIGLRRRKA